MEPINKTNIILENQIQLDDENVKVNVIKIKLGNRDEIMLLFYCFFPSVLKNGLSCVIYSFSLQLP